MHKQSYTVLTRRLLQQLRIRGVLTAYHAFDDRMSWDL